MGKAGGELGDMGANGGAGGVGGEGVNGGSEIDEATVPRRAWSSACMAVTVPCSAATCALSAATVGDSKSHVVRTTWSVPLVMSHSERESVACVADDLRTRSMSTANRVRAAMSGPRLLPSVHNFS